MKSEKFTWFVLGVAFAMVLTTCRDIVEHPDHIPVPYAGFGEAHLSLEDVQWVLFERAGRNFDEYHHDLYNREFQFVARLLLEGSPCMEADEGIPEEMDIANWLLYFEYIRECESFTPA